jgi:TldD protein
MRKLPDELTLSILKKVIATGCDFADVFVENRPHMSIQLESDRIEKIVSGIESGVGIRVVRGGKSTYAYSNDFSEGSLLELTETVSRTALEKENTSINLKKLHPEADFKIEQNPRAVGIDQKITVIRNANKIARKVSKKIKQVTVNYRDSIQNVYIASSEGSISLDERIYVVAIIQVVAAEDDILQFELFERESFEEKALHVAERAVAMLKAQKITGGRMPVVISADAGGTMIHEAIGHGLEADLAQQGLSVFSNKIGQQIASSLVTVIDDSTLQGKRGSFRFDDEGVPSQKTVLVEKGILKGYMYDRLTSMKDDVTSTGNGRRESYECRPIPRMTNTFIAPGSSDPLEIIKSVPKGLFVKKMGGGQVNTVTGEFVFEVSEGYLIEGGKIGETVRGATLIGNGPGILNSIDMVGNDLGFSIGTCGKDAQGIPVSDAMPTIRIPEIVVGGEA